MKKVNSVEEYIETHEKFTEALSVLRTIINSTELNESVKWNAPVYDLNGKNVVGLGAFNRHFGIWFFNGVFLKDEQKLLVNAQESKTKALRQMRFTTIVDIDKHIVLQYVKEAIKNQKEGKEIKPDRTKKETIIPIELKLELDNDAQLAASFKTLSPYKQREYCEHIQSTIRDVTKLSRIEKIKPMIINGVGLNDKYKNC